jgi:hypothetical protein
VRLLSSYDRSLSLRNRSLLSPWARRRDSDDGFRSRDRRLASYGCTGDRLTLDLICGQFHRLPAFDVRAAHATTDVFFVDAESEAAGGTAERRLHSFDVQRSQSEKSAAGHVDGTGGANCNVVLQSGLTTLALNPVTVHARRRTAGDWSSFARVGVGETA